MNGKGEGMSAGLLSPPLGERIEVSGCRWRAGVLTLYNRAGFRRMVTGSNTERNCNMGIGRLILVVLFLLGALPAWPHSKNWGYAPSGGLGLVVVILLMLVLTGRI